MACPPQKGSNNTLSFEPDPRGRGSVVGFHVITINNPAFTGTDNFTWTITLTNGSQATGNVIVTVPEAILTTRAITQDAVVRNEAGTLSFAGAIFDGNPVTFSDVAVTITAASTSTPSANITDLLTFTNTADVTANNDGTIITINAQQVSYTINDDAPTGSHTFTYTATSGGESSSSTITIPISPSLGGGLVDRIVNLLRADNTLGNTESVLILTGSDIFNSIDGFGGFSLSDLTITFPNGGVSTTEGSNNTLTFEPDPRGRGSVVGFHVITINNPAFTGTDNFTWTITHTNGSRAAGTVTVTVPEATLTTRAITQDAVVRNEAGALSFAGAIFDGNPVTFSDVAVTITAASTSTPSASITDLLTFTNTADVTANNDDTIITINAQQVSYTINDDAPTGSHTFTYTATSGGESSSSTITIPISPSLGGGLVDRIYTLSRADNTLGNTESVLITTGSDIFNSFTGEGLADFSLSDLTITFPNGGVSTTEGSNNTLTFETDSRGSVVGFHVITINNPAFTGTDNFTWTITHTNGSQAAGTVTVTVPEATLTTRNIMQDAVVRGEAGALSFTGAIFDGNPVTFSDVTTVTITSVSTSNSSVSITDLLTFTNTADVTANNDDTIITINAQQVSYTINDDAPTGSHTFTYTVTSGGESSSSTITIVIPEMSLTCESNIDENFELGQIGIGSISKIGTMVVSNTGGLDITALAMSADPWMGDIDDTLTAVINAEQTRYSFAETDSYADRTSFTGAPTNATASISADGSPLQVYVQVIPILNSPYEIPSEGLMINQTVMITSSCE